MPFPLHPAIVHFPIALITAALIFHTLHLYKPEWINRTIGLWLLGLSTIFSIVAVLSGQKEIQKAGELGYPTETLILIERHQTIGNIVVWGSILLFIGWLFLYLKNQVNNKVNHLAFAFLLLLFVIVIISGYTGGYLVYIHGVGTP
ncbi:uncharacterized protein METZ01_LOCUS44794 [marine metagenome]|uniref:DUF2231 domain-containing protein n=1 Tax=marine metagenome TaxID=408172 RepID=A0A381RJE6_9ZZZZ